MICSFKTKGWTRSGSLRQSIQDAGRIRIPRPGSTTRSEWLEMLRAFGPGLFWEHGLSPDEMARELDLDSDSRLLEALRLEQYRSRLVPLEENIEAEAITLYYSQAWICLCCGSADCPGCEGEHWWEEHPDGYPIGLRRSQAFFSDRWEEYV